MRPAQKMELLPQEKTPWMELEALANRSNSSVIDDHRPAAFMKSEIPIRNALRQNRAMFLGLEKRLFQLV